MTEGLRIEQTRIPRAFRITPTRHPDERGYFFEAFRSDDLDEAIGYPFRVRQQNYSSSRRGTIRGIHTTALPPGQAKFVSCIRGRVLDVVVDLRVGSPTFGEFELTEQGEDTGTAVYLADGLGHAFIALTDDAVMSYLCSEIYVPGTMIEIDALDPAIGIPWEIEVPPTMSEKDAAAVGLSAAVEQGLLPAYDDCLAHYENLRSR